MLWQYLSPSRYFFFRLTLTILCTIISMSKIMNFQKLGIKSLYFESRIEPSRYMGQICRCKKYFLPFATQSFTNFNINKRQFSCPTIVVAVGWYIIKGSNLLHDLAKLDTKAELKLCSELGRKTARIERRKKTFFEAVLAYQAVQCTACIFTNFQSGGRESNSTLAGTPSEKLERKYSELSNFHKI